MKDGLKIFDSDLHVIENGDVYERHLAAEFRASMPEYLGVSPANFPHWRVGSQLIPPWALNDDVIRAQAFLDKPSQELYAEARARQYDAATTLKAMDAEGIDFAVMFRTFAHMIVSIDDLEPRTATAYCAAFNDWLADYCAINPARLKPSAIVSLHDPELAAAEARRAVEQMGHAAIVLLPMPVNGRYPHAPECDVLWREISRLGVPLTFHGTSGGASKDYAANRYRNHPNFRTLNHSSAFPMELMLAMGAMLTGGVCEKFPLLRIGFLEGNCGWLPWWLARLDDQWKKYGGGEKLRLSALPSEYFLRQCFIGTDVDEDLLSVVVDRFGDDNVVVSVDYPHADGPFPEGISEFLELTGVPRASKQKMLWDNSLRLYGLDGDQPGKQAA